MTDPDEDIAILRDRVRKGDRSVATRRLKETRPMAYAERRKLAPKTDRTEPTYFKFTPAFKQRLIALAVREGVPMVEIIERAVDLYATREAQ